MLWHHQEEAVRDILSRRSLLLGDDVGLGKSVTAIAAIRAANAYPAMIVCPDFLKPMWERLALDWFLRPIDPVDERVLWTPECIAIPDTTLGFKVSARRPVVIVNYEELIKRHKKEPKEPGFTFDIKPKKKAPKEFLSKTGEDLVAMRPRAVVFDESNYVKNGKAARTRACKSIARNADFRILLSATPVETGPQELVAQLEILDRIDRFGGAWDFIMKYTDAHKDEFGYWDFSGASNLIELHERLKAICYLRRTKTDVQQYLPSLRQEILPLPLSNAEEYRKAESDVLSWIAVHQGLEAADAATRAEALVRMSVLRQLVAKGKVDATLAFTRAVLESGERLVIFTYHQELAETLAKATNGFLVTGSMTVAQREANRTAFALASAPALMVATIKASRFGIDLTAASNALFLESAWTSTANDQAVGRLHRHGQTKPVMAWFTQARGTVDEDVARVVERRRGMAASVTDGVPEVEPTEDTETAELEALRSLAARRER